MLLRPYTHMHYNDIHHPSLSISISMESYNLCPSIYLFLIQSYDVQYIYRTYGFISSKADSMNCSHYHHHHYYQEQKQQASSTIGFDIQKPYFYNDDFTIPSQSQTHQCVVTVRKPWFWQRSWGTIYYVEKMYTASRSLSYSNFRIYEFWWLSKYGNFGHIIFKFSDLDNENPNVYIWQKTWHGMVWCWLVLVVVGWCGCMWVDVGLYGLAWFV